MKYIRIVNFSRIHLKAKYKKKNSCNKKIVWNKKNKKTITKLIQILCINKKKKNNKVNLINRITRLTQLLIYMMNF